MAGVGGSASSTRWSGTPPSSRAVASASTVAMALLILTSSPVAAARQELSGLEVLLRAPGLDGPALSKLLAAADLEPFPSGPRAAILEATPMPSIFEEQRVVLILDDLGNVSSVHVQVLPEPGSRGADVLRLYADVRDALTRSLGRPAWERTEGSGDVSTMALSDGSAIRYLQWEGETAVRAGIPRRVDGEVLVEIAMTPSPLPRREEYWGARIF